MLETALVIGMVMGLHAAPEADSQKTEQVRTPLVHDDSVRSTELSYLSYERPLEVVRARSPGKRYASFKAEPRLLQDGVAMVFEIHSVAVTGKVSRWHCVATEDVADCLGQKVRVRYLPRDEKVVLTAKVVPEHEVDRIVQVLASR